MDGPPSRNKKPLRRSFANNAKSAASREMMELLKKYAMISVISMGGSWKVKTWPSERAPTAMAALMREYRTAW